MQPGALPISLHTKNDEGKDVYLLLLRTPNENINATKLSANIDRVRSLSNRFIIILMPERKNRAREGSIHTFHRRPLNEIEALKQTLQTDKTIAKVDDLCVRVRACASALACVPRIATHA